MKTWNKIASVLTAMVTTISLLLSCNVSFSSEAADVWEEMSLTATELVDDITLGWNLGNTLDYSSKYSLTSSVLLDERQGNAPITTEEMVKTIKATGINAIRIPVTWFPHMDENNMIDEAWMKRVHEIVDYVVNNDMYCILNLHNDTGSNGWLKASSKNFAQNSEKFKIVWKQIATSFSDYDEHLLFEGFNEMTNEENSFAYSGIDATTAINKYNQLFVDTVRSTGGNNISRCLVCNTYGTLPEYNVLSDYILPNDIIENRLIAQVHIYSPWKFCSYEYDDETIYKSDELKYALSNVKTMLCDKGIPTIIGEFAAVDKNNLDERIKWVNDYLSTTEQYGIKCFLWDDNGLYNSFSRDFLTWREPEMIETMMKNVGIDYHCEDYPSYKLEEGNLSSYLCNYSHYTMNGGLMDISSYDVQKNSITATVLDSGNAVRDVYLYYHNINLTENRQYKLSFDASCNEIENLPVSCNITKWLSSEEYFAADLKLTKSPQTYEYIFTMPETACCMFSLFIGNSDNSTTPYDVTISNLMVTEYTSAADMSLTAAELVDDITFGWNLGNTLDTFTDVAVDAPAYYETSASNPITEKHMLDTVKASGINAVRIPVTWFYHMDENNIVDEAWMNRVQEVVDYVIDNDMYCILNVHHDGLEHNWLKASMNNYNTNKEKFETLWRQIAERFQDYDEHLLFEGFNEVTDDNINWTTTSEDGFAAINSYNQLFVDTVRATGGNNTNRCLICNTYAAASTESALEQYQLPVDTVENRLIAEVHSYEPYQFCFVEYPDVTTFNGEFSTFNNIEKYLLEKGIPTIIGEFACYDKNNLSERLKWADAFTKNAAALGIKCFWWDDGNLLARNFDHWKYPEVLETCLKNFGIDYTCPDFPAYGLEQGNLTPYLYNYTTYFDNSLATVGYNTDSNSVTIHVLNGGIEANSVQLFYNGVNLEEGKQYKITFDAQCSGIDKISPEFSVLECYPSFAEHFKVSDIEFTDTKKSFDFIFTMDEIKEIQSVLFLFCVGNGDVDYSYDVTISSLMVTEYTGKEMLKGDINFDRTINVTDVILLQNYLLNRSSLTSEQGTYADLNQDATVNVSDLMLLKKMVSEQINQNLLPDMSEWTYHILDGLANINIDAAAQTVQANVSQASAEQWQIETQAGDIALESGKAYQLTFDASCTTDTEMLFGITRIDDGNYPVCWRNTANLSTEMQTYSYTFTLRYSTQSDFYLYFDYGNTAGNYIIKNLKLIEVGTNLLPDVTD